MPFVTESPEPASSTGLRERKKLAARAAIVDAALDLFADRGFDQTTVADIAERAGVSPATVARYFPAKESLLFSERDDRITKLRESVAARPEDESPYRAVLAAIHEQPWVVGDTESRLLRSRLAVARSPTLRGQAAVVLANWREQIATAMERRGLDPVQANVVATVSTALLDECMDRWAAEGGTTNPFDVVDEAFAALEASCRNEP